MKPSTSNRFINGALVTALFTITSVSLISYHQSNKVKDTKRIVERTHAIIGQIDAVLLAATEIQTYETEYALTKNGERLAQLNAATDELTKSVQSLDQFAIDHVFRETLLDTLKMYVRKRVEVSQKIVSIIKSNGSLVNDNQFHDEERKSYLYQIKFTAARMKVLEDTLLKARSLRNDKSIFYYDILLTLVLMTTTILAFLLFDRVKKGFQQQRKSEEKIKALLETGPDALIITNEAGRIKMINSQTVKMFGYAKSEIIGKPVELLLPEKVKENHCQYPGYLFSKAAEMHNGGELEMSAVKKDRRHFPVAINLSPLNTEDGLLLSASIRDITQRKKNQQRLDLLNQLVEESNDAIITVDRRLVIDSWNYGAEVLFGYSKEEAIGKRSVDLVRMDLDETQQLMILQCVQQEGYWTGEIKRFGKNNVAVNVISSITAVKDKTGKITGYISVNYDIGEQKKLRKQVEHLASIVEQSSEAIVSRGSDNRIISWNLGAEKLFGYKKEEVLGKTATELGIIRFSAVEIDEMEEALAMEGKWSAEKKYYCKNGSEFIGEVIANAIYDTAGNVESIIFMLRDITTRRRYQDFLLNAREELERKVIERTDEVRKSERRYRDTLENMLEGVQIIDHDLRYIYVNKAVAGQANMTREQLTGHLVTDLFPGVEATPLFERIMACMNEKKHLYFETPFTFPNGVLRYFQLSMQPVPEGIFILSVDITERKKIEDELEASSEERKRIAEKFSIVLNTLPASIIVLDEQGVILDVNESWKKFGVENGFSYPEYGVGINYMEVCLKSHEAGCSDGQKAAEGIAAVLQHSADKFECEYTFDDLGSNRWFRMLVTPLNYGKYSGAVVMHINITDEKNMEQERMHARIEEQKVITRAMLDGQEKERTEIGRELHDNIMQIIAGVKMKLGLFLSTLPEKPALLEQTLVNIQTALKETRDLSHRMVMPRFGTGVFESEVRQLLTDYASDTRTVTFSFGNFDDTAVPVPVKETLYRILQEQLNNIEKYSAASAITFTINIQDKEVWMTICDDGKGFDPFIKRKGIGLTNIQNRAESFEGTAVIDSRPDNGCKLEIHIPLRESRSLQEI